VTKVNTYSAVIIEYFSGEHLFECIDSLLQQTLKAEKIVVVNNGTSSESKEKLKQYSNIQIIDASENLGYARAANLGISNTETNIIATLNPDIILETDCAQIIVDTMSQNSQIAAVGPLIYETNGSVYPSARKDPGIKVAIGHAILSLFTKNNKYSREYRNIDIDKDNPSNVDWLSGAAIFLSRDALDKVGMWDERFFMYCEDIDLCNSLRTKGYECIFEPRAKIVHVGGASTSSTPIKYLIMHHKSLYLFAAKKYKDKPLIKLLASIFIAFRLPLAILKARFI
jgi:N-acetylglucosaminyl-diphospho-decaprenol L-rhamnosyltransferase